jgi:hypothetical protein
VARGKGLFRPDATKEARRIGASLHAALRGAAPPKGQASLTPCPRLDQGESSTCHAHSAAGAIWTACVAAGKALPWIPSPQLIASTTYADVRAATVPAGQPLPPLLDTGADLSDDAAALARWGIAPIGPPIPGRGGLSDVPDDPPSNVFPEVDPSRLVLAGADLISGDYSIPVDANAPTLCAQALDAGIPIWLATGVDTDFENLGPSAIAQPAAPGSDGHALYLSAYRTASDHSFEWLVQNSWGSDWAADGAVWASQAWLEACWMLWLMAVVR